MTDRFDEGKRGLEGVPARDVWAEAQRRAADGDPGVVPLAPMAGRLRRPRRWLAVAAASLLAVGTVAVVADRDDKVDVGGGPGGSPSGEDVTVYQADGGCKLGITGDPLPEPATVVPADTFVEGSVGTKVYGDLNDTQTYEVQVPGEVVDDLIGERVEDIELERGTAQLWFRTFAAPDGSAVSGVQVRWFTGSQEACESFTATVNGGSEDENRHAAVSLAERVLVSSEVDDSVHPTPGAPVDHLDDTYWQLERSTIDGEPTEGSGLLFSFRGGEAGWTDGCNHLSGTYTTTESTLVITDVTSTRVSCEATPTLEAVNTVMGAGEIEWVVDDRGLLVLSAGDAELELRRTDPPSGPDPVGGLQPAAAAYGIWPMTGPEATFGYRPEVIASAEETAAEFARSVLDWDDAVIDETSGEPPHDGIGVLDVAVQSPSRDRTIHVSVRVAEPATDGHNVYRVSTEGVGEATVRVEDGVGSVFLESTPAGTTYSQVDFIYGEYTYQGDLGEEIVFGDTGPWDDQAPGAVLVLFRDGAGDILGAWGRALSSGDQP